MTSRQRLLSIFNGQQVDRVPVSPFIWSNFANEFFKARLSGEDLDKKVYEIYKYFGFDVMLRTCTIWEPFDESYNHSKNWKVTIQNNCINDRKRIEVITVKTPERELKQVKEYENVTENEEISAITEHFIKSEDDFKQFLKFQPEVGQYNCSRITKAKEIVGEDGLVCPWTQGVFNCASEHRKLDDLIMDAYISPGFYNSIMDYFMKRWIKIAVQYVNAGADVLCYNGNIANGTMAGPEYFEKNVLKYEKQLIDSIQERGTHVLYHNCGDSNSLFSIYNKVGFSGLETLTEPPYGDTDLEYAISVLNKNVTLVGNIDQIDFLKKASREEVSRSVKRLLKITKPRGNFILGTSDYLSEGTPYENIKALADAGKE